VTVERKAQSSERESYKTISTAYSGKLHSVFSTSLLNAKLAIKERPCQHTKSTFIALIAATSIRYS
jgi:hypothetical protein